MRNIVVSGARPLGITDGLKYGNPTNEEVFYQMKQSISGISKACHHLEVPVVSGNVSMYNQSYGEPIYPTPIIGMVGLLETTDNITPNSFQQAGDAIYLIGETSAEFGGSELQRLIEGDYKGKPPAIDLEKEKQSSEKLLQAIRKGLIQSAEDLAEGGLAVALSESVIRSEGLGANVTIIGNPTVALFSESQSRYLVTVKEQDVTQFEALNFNAKRIGTVTADGMLTVKNEQKETILSETVEYLKEIWEQSIEKSLN